MLKGLASPTLSSLRALIHGLERCESLITKENIAQLVSAAGLSPADLVATTHDVVASIHSGTRLKPLLTALRNSADLDVTIGAVGHGSGLASKLPNWEHEGTASSPSLSQVTALLHRYNELLREKGRDELTRDEIEKVLDVAERDRNEGLSQGFEKRARKHRQPVSRRAIRPDFDSGQSR